MPSERYDDARESESNLPNCTEVEFTQPDDLRRAAEFDTLIFSQHRRQLEGEDVAQPTVDTDEYRRLIANSGKVLAYTENDTGNIIAICTIALNKDPRALEPMLQNMPPDMAYMTVAAVREDYRGQGLGHIMLQKRLEIARDAGKTKAITTVHHTNIASMGNLIKAGFLGVGRLDNYYNLEGGDGERIIMYHGDLNDPDWSIKSTDTTRCDTTGRYLPLPRFSFTNPIPDPALASPTTRSLTLSELGFCINRVTVDAFNEPVYHWVTFTPGDKLRLPPLVFPHDSLTEAYTAKLNLDPQRRSSWSAGDRIIHENLEYIDDHYPWPESDTLIEANTRKFFMDWVLEYRTFFPSIINKIGDDAVFTPSFDKAMMSIEPSIKEIVLLFLHNENGILWSFIHERQPQTETDLLTQDILPPAIDMPLDSPTEINKATDSLIFTYAEQNALLHYYINGYYKDVAAQLPWPYNKEGFVKFRNHICSLLGRRALNFHDLYWS